MEFGRGRNLINGEWVNSNSKEILEVRNPALDEVIAEVHQAIQGAKEAFPEGDPRLCLPGQGTFSD